MKKVIILTITAFVLMPVLTLAGTENGAPSGAHYNLNLIGVPKEKSASMDNNNGHRIFVPLNQDGVAEASGKYGTKISLIEGDDFRVLDANGTDKNGASFQLPNPDPDGDGTTEYSVFVRALGKPGGRATMQTCYTDIYGDTWCAIDVAGGVSTIEIERTKGKQRFENVTKDLLFVDYCVAYDLTDPLNPVCTDWDQIPLFGDEAEEFFWDYDNNGLKVAQLRFYEIPTEVSF